MRLKLRPLFSGFRLTAIGLGLVLGIAAFVGCSFSSNPLTGTFLDSPVSGLNYATLSRLGLTDANGQFAYYAHETVSFSIGALSLGSGRGAEQMTPLSITAKAASAADQAVNNKLILLQTLDADGDLNNGIQITEAIRTIVSGSVFTDASFRGARTVRDAYGKLGPAGAITPKTGVAAACGDP